MTPWMTWTSDPTDQIAGMGAAVQTAAPFSLGELTGQTPHWTQMKTLRPVGQLQHIQHALGGIRAALAWGLCPENGTRTRMRSSPPPYIERYLLWPWQSYPGWLGRHDSCVTICTLPKMEDTATPRDQSLRARERTFRIWIGHPQLVRGQGHNSLRRRRYGYGGHKSGARGSAQETEKMDIDVQKA